MKLQIFPLLTISFLIYAALTLIGVTGPNGEEWWRTELVVLPLQSDRWHVSGGDVFLIGSLGLLFVELTRATKLGQSSTINNALSFMLFVAVLLCFVLVKGFGNSTYFLFMAMTLLDPMAGIVVTTATARRDLNLGTPSGGGGH
jgi:multisubunit Na+/H+ antiporter MnhG subunit